MAPAQTPDDPVADLVVLWDPQFEGYSYGPGDRGQNIDFGTRGGFEPHVWIGPKEHPLLPDLLRERPDLIEGDGSTQKIVKVYICPTCSKECASLLGFQSHQRTHRGGQVEV